MAAPVSRKRRSWPSARIASFRARGSDESIPAGTGPGRGAAHPVQGCRCSVPHVMVFIVQQLLQQGNDQPAVPGGDNRMSVPRLQNHSRLHQGHYPGPTGTPSSSRRSSRDTGVSRPDGAGAAILPRAFAMPIRILGLGSWMASRRSPSASSPIFPSAS